MCRESYVRYSMRSLTSSVSAQISLKLNQLASFLQSQFFSLSTKHHMHIRMAIEQSCRKRWGILYAIATQKGSSLPYYILMYWHHACANMDILNRKLR